MERNELGERVALARQRAGKTQAELAAEVALDRSSLAKVENGTRRVSALELARIAEAVHERIEWFFRPAPPAVISHRNQQEPGAASPAIDRLIERAARHVEFVNKRAGQALRDIGTLPRPGSLAEAETSAAKARTLLGVEADGPVSALVDRMAAEVGLFAFSFDLGADAADAASMLLREGGIAIVNGARQVGRRRLALAHELGHYLFADEYTVDWRVAEQDGVEGWEARLDRFARAFLVPAATLRKDLDRLTNDDADLRTIAVMLGSLYQVDMATLARRLTEVGLLSSSDADFVRSVRTGKADIIDLNLVPKNELEPPCLPKPYTKSVLALYRKSDISAARAIDLLFDTWTEEELPPIPQLPENAIWEFVS
ncbi:Zn-dependent peptidase ImmA (M78 family)/DNA-binding XRE family transcriptional regulator [Sphaerisporangium rubeum]|uniref:Zn-dependent peptidase ImmA (M78 family)/DNA-binding XRE family transcriptional regulator n=1 Tax=Sphaerisporangium rubeum TaxID=321317 RepID=A0A7X0IID0_9ACTN|nr:Zn-dependent peptidase ImmA (M78 family)/DNA-binding XRE family transcriptional regulator [Sphaerisporangium rubeum]